MLLLTQEIEVLREKRHLARQWLEKVKTSMQSMYKVGSRNNPRRGGGGEVVIDIEKPNFETLKQIVIEGEQLLNDDDDDDYHHVSNQVENEMILRQPHLSSFERAQNRAQTKEFNRVASIGTIMILILV